MIHYHGTPIGTDIRGVVNTLKGKHAMVSFERPDQLDIVAEVCHSFCFDNGAFSAWKRGAEFDIEGYAQFVHEWCRHPGFDWYVMPDVIDSDHHKNSAMIGRWRNVLSDYKVFAMGVPVWHLHEPISYLRDLVHAYPRVALGSSGAYATPGNAQWWSRMADAMEVCCDEEGRPKTRLHGLRMLDPTIFSHLPLSSADSTNMARNMGIDSAWKGTYVPKTKATRAAIIAERIEAHASAARWCGKSSGVQQNLELFG